MRKYEYQKESKNIATLLARINKFERKMEVARELKIVSSLRMLKAKIRFYFEIFIARFMIERSKHYDLISENDSKKLKDIWSKILKRKYQI